MEMEIAVVSAPELLCSAWQCPLCVMMSLWVHQQPFAQLPTTLALEPSSFCGPHLVGSGPSGTWFLIPQPRLLQQFPDHTMHSSCKAAMPSRLRCSHSLGSSVTHLPLATGHQEGCGEAGYSTGRPLTALQIIPTHPSESPLFQNLILSRKKIYIY